jgi:hypothetical protein
VYFVGALNSTLKNLKIKFTETFSPSVLGLQQGRPKFCGEGSQPLLWAG